MTTYEARVFSNAADLDPTVIFTPGMRLEEVERAVILETLKQKGFNRTHTAKALGIGIRTLQRKLKKYGASDLGLSENYGYLKN